MRIEVRRKVEQEVLSTDATSSYRLREFRLNRYPFIWHLHPEVELTLIVRGRGNRFVGDSVHDFREGDLCLLGPNLPHTWQSEAEPGKSVHSVVVQFLPKLVTEWPTTPPELLPIIALIKRSERGLVLHGVLRDTVERGLLELLKIPVESARRITLLMELLAHISESDELTALAAQVSPPSDKPDTRRLDAVFAHLNANWRRRIMQNEVADIAGLSPAAFSRFFHRLVGATFVSHLRDLRISHACRQLLETDRDIAAIAFDCGFDNLSNFNRQFRQVKKMSPSDYRKRTRT
jgi:AraC-like DNA-binding protein/quercetin dioxygenase-like cupin family protein